MYNLPTERLDAIVRTLALRMAGASSQNTAKLYTCTPSIKLSTKNLRCFYTATATENNVTLVLLGIVDRHGQ